MAPGQRTRVQGNGWGTSCSAPSGALAEELSEMLGPWAAGPWEPGFALSWDRGGGGGRSVTQGACWLSL